MGKSILDPIGKSPQFCVFNATDLPNGGRFDLGWDEDDDDDDDDEMMMMMMMMMMLMMMMMMMMMMVVSSIGVSPHAGAHDLVSNIFQDL